MKTWLLVLALASGCATIDPYARGFFGAVQALDRGFQQSGATQAAAQGLFVPQPYYAPQSVIVQQSPAVQPRSLVPPAPAAPPVGGPVFRPFSAL